MLLLTAIHNFEAKTTRLHLPIRNSFPTITFINGTHSIFCFFFLSFLQISNNNKHLRFIDNDAKHLEQNTHLNEHFISRNFDR